MFSFNFPLFIIICFLLTCLFLYSSYVVVGIKHIIGNLRSFISLKSAAKMLTIQSEGCYPSDTTSGRLGIGIPTGTDVSRKTRLWQLHFQTFSNMCEFHRFLEMTIIYIPCQNRYGTLKNPHCSMTVTAEHRSPFTAVKSLLRHALRRRGLFVAGLYLWHHIKTLILQVAEMKQ